MAEIWKQWRDGTYEVSNMGNIRRSKPGISTFVGRPVRPLSGSTGYAQVTLRSGGKSFRTYVHRAVMEAFVGKCPKGYVVNHKNCDKLDNRLENLEYVTAKKNSEHALQNNRRERGPKKPRAPKKGMPTGDKHWTKKYPEKIARENRMPHTKITRDQVKNARERVRNGETQTALAKELGICGAQMSRIIRRKRWTHM